MNNRRFTAFHTTSLILLSLVLASCASTVSDRINANPEGFACLSQQDQALVRNSRLRKGMSMSAVELAWGKPTSTAAGVVDGKETVRWIYQDGGSGFSFGFGGGMGHFNNRSSVIGTGVGMSFPVATVPTNTSYVLFSEGKVVSWEDGHQNRQ